MKKFNLISLMMIFILTTGLLAGCTSQDNETSSSHGENSSEEIKITLLNSKGEIQEQLEEAAEIFNAANPNITLEVAVAPAGQSPFEKISAMYASGNAPALAMLDPKDIINLSDKFSDLSNEKWVEDAVDNSLDTVTIDGKVMAFPFTVEGAGFIYNKEVLDKAGVDPTGIKTRKDLKDAFDKIQASGNEALAICPVDWSLAGHFLPISYATQSSDSSEVDNFLNDLKEGKVDLANNAQFNGLMDTFDLMKEYNKYKDDPLVATYESNQQEIALGEIGFWFMGNWAWPQIYEFAQREEGFGFIAVPISDEVSDYGNAGIPVGVTKYIAIDKENNTEAQQEAAKKFLEWIVYDKDGQDAIANKANVITAFKNIDIEPKDPLGKSIKEYMNEGNTIQFMTTMPSDHWSILGASMQKYLVGVIDRDGLIEEIKTYWENVKR